MRFPSSFFASDSGISKVMGFINYKNIGVRLEVLHYCGVIPIRVRISEQVRVVDDFQSVKTPLQVWGVLVERRFPNRFSGRLRDNEGYALSVSLRQILNDHQSDEGFA